MNKIVGKNVTAKEYWDKKKDSYLTSFEGPYHKHRLSVIENLLRNVDFKKKNILDFGCGDGSLLSKNFSKISKWLLVKVSSNRPICCYYKLDSDSYVRLFLAPKIDDDDE